VRMPKAWPSRAALRIETVLRSVPAARIGFPTGATPLPLFAELARRRGAGLRTETIRPFALDEYRGVPASHPASLASFLRRLVVEPLGMAAEAFLHFDGTAAEPSAECARYEAALTEGIDLAILGLGSNGHVAFDEPGSARDSRTRIVDLTPGSIAAARPAFPGQPAPTQALTVGIATLLAARSLMLLVTGAGKADILHRALRSPQGPEVPASFLRDHPGLLVVADRAAAARL